MRQCRWKCGLAASGLALVAGVRAILLPSSDSVDPFPAKYIVSTRSWMYNFTQPTAFPTPAAVERQGSTCSVCTGRSLFRPHRAFELACFPPATIACNVFAKPAA